MEDEDFATLFAASEMQTKRFQTGQTITGTIVAIGAAEALVNVGAKGEASIDRGELTGEDGTLAFKVGDRIEATVMSTSGGITLSRRLQRGAATARQIEDAYRAGLPVEGKVEAQVKGGYTVTIARQRAFCPFSQIDTIRAPDPAVHEGRVYPFRITEYGDGGRRFVVSRRALLQEDQAVKAAAVRQGIAPGMTVKGRVASVREFGAFVDIGGNVQGLLHVSEMSWTRVADPSAVVKPGDEITVRVLRVEDDKIALGLKQLTEDPWTAAAAGLQIGQLLNGTVEKVEKFGVFVAVAPGVSGLVPASETGLPRDADLRKAFPRGAPLDVIVLEIDAAARRIRLSSKAVAAAREDAEVRDYAARDAAPSSSMGSLADRLRSALKRSDGE
ncbi:MAG TPA: S1 RNA-binding domain-containing protein [Vicinamibacterales bacterium]|jgi:small subunit ribosomal protein S1